MLLLLLICFNVVTREYVVVVMLECGRERTYAPSKFENNALTVECAATHGFPAFDRISHVVDIETCNVIIIIIIIIMKIVILNIFSLSLSLSLYYTRCIDV